MGLEKLDKDKVWWERTVLGTRWKLHNLEDIGELLKAIDSRVKNKYIVCRWFTKGYKEPRGFCRCFKWPFKMSAEEFTKKFDAIFWVSGIEGQTLTWWTSSKGLPK